MTNKVTKYGLMTIAAVLLVAMAFAGAASAAGTMEVNAETWNSWGNDVASHIGSNDTVKFIGTGIIYPKFNVSSQPGFTPSDNLTLDFSNYQGTFYGEPIHVSSGKRGAIFGNVDLSSVNTERKLTIKNVDIENLMIDAGGGYNGGVVGYFTGNSTENSYLEFINCHLENCSVYAGWHASYAGGIISRGEYGSMVFDSCSVQNCKVYGDSADLAGFAAGSPRVNVSVLNDCRVVNCTFEGGQNIAGLICQAKYLNVDGGDYQIIVENTSLSASGIADEDTYNVGGIIAYLRGSSGPISNCVVNNCVLSALPNNIGAGGTNTGAIVGAAGGDPFIISNCRVSNSVISADKNAGGFIGSCGEVTFTGTNVLNNVAVNGSNNIGLFAGSGIVNGENTVAFSLTYLNNTSIPNIQPIIRSFTHTQTLPSVQDLPEKTKIIVYLTGIGKKSDLKEALGYVIGLSDLEFNPNNGTEEKYAGTVMEGMTKITSFIAPVYMGHTFNGWNLTSGSGTMLTDATGNLQAEVIGYTDISGCWIYNSKDPVPVYANWTAHTYNVTFSNTTGTGIMTNQTLTYDVAASLKPNTFTKSGFTFAGWNKTSADGTTVDFADQASVLNLTDVDNGAVALYAVWTENPPVYTPSSSSKQTGSTIILQEGQVAPNQVPTTTPTVAPTVKPTEQPATPTVIATAKPTTQATQQSPAPFLGILAGLGAAAVLLRLRK